MRCRVNIIFVTQVLNEAQEVIALLPQHLLKAIKEHDREQIVKGKSLELVFHLKRIQQGKQSFYVLDNRHVGANTYLSTWRGNCLSIYVQTSKI